MQHHEHERGFTLIETMIGVMLLGSVLVGPVTFLTSTFTRTGASEDKLTALYLSQEGIELVRLIRDNNVLAEVPWNQGLSDGSYEIDYDSGLTSYSAPGTTLLYDASSVPAGIYSYNSGVATRFRRYVVLSASAPDQMSVTSIVSWTDRSATKSVQLKETIYNWQ
jgi:prepilin-type N-terminal cleavage/methylation domain-containing protein